MSEYGKTMLEWLFRIVEKYFVFIVICVIGVYLYVTEIVTGQWVVSKIDQIINTFNASF